MAWQTAQRTRQELLGVYLNDHLASSTTSMNLARRMVAAAEPGSERATVLNSGGLGGRPSPLHPCGYVCQAAPRRNRS